VDSYSLAPPSRLPSIAAAAVFHPLECRRMLLLLLLPRRQFALLRHSRVQCAFVVSRLELGLGLFVGAEIKSVRQLGKET